MFIYDVAHGTLCAVSQVHSSLSTVWAIGCDENVGESIHHNMYVAMYVAMRILFYSGALYSEKNHKSGGQSSWMLDIYYSEVI